MTDFYYFKTDIQNRYSTYLFFFFILVRSIASVSLRKSRTASFHFDFFTVSFSKDYSALYGGMTEKYLKNY